MATLHHADARKIPLPDRSVHCMVTSPPYWGLRDYGLGDWQGGDIECQHVQKQLVSGGQNSDTGSQGVSGPCLNCGAVKTPEGIGLEPTLGKWVANVVAVMREVWRVLRDDGIAWLNLGDAYTSGGRNTQVQDTTGATRNSGYESGSMPEGLKAKNIMGQPWRVAFALQDDGWILRSPIVWRKSNPMPESAPDRPTSAYEMIFMLTKTNTSQFWTHRDSAGQRTTPRPDYRWQDALTGLEYTEEPEAYTEDVIPCPDCGGAGIITIESGQVSMFDGIPAMVVHCGNCQGEGGIQRWKRTNLWASHDYFYDADAVREPITGGAHAKRKDGSNVLQHGRDANDNRNSWQDSYQATSANARNVWTIPTQGRPDAHFACVDAETECLTAQGWKRHDDISDGDLAAQFDVETQTLSWGDVESVARYSVANQEMVVCDRRDLDMRLTPNHRCVIRRRHPKTREYLNPVIVRADELKPSHSIPTAANWLYEGVEPMSSDWAELLGWYIAEGYESKHSMAVEIYQSPSANPEKTKRIEELLQRVEAEYTSSTGNRKWRGRDSSCTAFRVLGYAAVRLRELSPKKAIPSDVLLWSNHLIEAILKGLIEGDGHERTDGRSVFVQKSEQSADMVQAMVLRLGMSATCSVKADGMRRVYITKHRTRSFRTSGGEYQTSRDGYTGIVWCPKTPNGTWVARRNGRAFITGNTFPDELPRRCIMAGTSAKGVCEECGAPWVRMHERTGHINKREPAHVPMNTPTKIDSTGWAPTTKATDHWQPTCVCNAGIVPATVLDPFAGSGTTLAVAQANRRKSIGLDLKKEYLDIAKKYIMRGSTQRK